MTDPAEAEVPPATIFTAVWIERLNRPLTPFACVMGWIGASALFLGLVKALGGPTEGDAAESVYSTWAIAHGNLACAYPPSTSYHFPSIADPFAFSAPMYPLFTGFFSAILRIGHHVPFPHGGQMGTNCSQAFVEIFRWSIKSSSINPTINISYLMWPILMFGAIALLRTSGRGRRGWEPLTLFLLAAAPPILMCIVDFFHPQDVMALGLGLGGLACVRRTRWGWAGVLLGLSFASQQFGILLAAPLLVIAPGGHRLRYLASLIGSVAVVSVPLVVFSSGRALTAVLFGSNRIGLVNSAGWRSRGGTVLWEINLRGMPLLFLSRIVPIVLAMALAWWLLKRLGPSVLEPVPLLALIATSLTLRLVFEENMFGYYFMAVAALLLLLDVIVGRIRGHVIAWVTLVSLAFNPVHWGLYPNWTPWGRQLFQALPIVAMIVGGATILFDAFHLKIRPYKILWFLAVALACEPQFWGPSVGQQVLPTWCWQVILVPIAVTLAASPLLAVVRERSSRNGALADLG